jgi:hypothetical protein
MVWFDMTFIHTKSRLMSPRRAVVFLVPILGLSTISCGGDSDSSAKASEAEFCAMLQAIKSDQVFEDGLEDFENGLEDSAALTEATELLTDLAKAAPTTELKEDIETLILIWETMATPEALASLMELMSDPKIESAGETVNAYSTDVCKITTSDSGETSTEESLAP